FVLQYKNRLHQARRQLVHASRSTKLPGVELLQHRDTFRCDVRRWAGGEGHSSPDPYDGCNRIGGMLQPTAPPFSFQAALSAYVALPRGLIPKLKMERDNQF